MKYSEHSLRNKKPLEKFKTDWSHSEGVFETPRGKWIVRVKKIGANNQPFYNTISQHDSEQEANTAFEFYKAHNK